MSTANYPGWGSSINPETGETFDKIVPIIQGFDWLFGKDKAKISESNARRLYKLDVCSAFRPNAGGNMASRRGPVRDPIRCGHQA